MKAYKTQLTFAGEKGNAVVVELKNHGDLFSGPSTSMRQIGTWEEIYGVPRSGWRHIVQRIISAMSRLWTKSSNTAK